MIRRRPANERGHASYGWLDTYHTFSFADYYDPDHVQFRHLRVLNEDRVKPGAGFSTHGHRDMEILTILLHGAIEHQDSTGVHGVIERGDVQRMTAGTGVLHSEKNPSATEPAHLLQIWIVPDQRGLAPSYEQRSFDEAGRRGKWQVIAARDGRDGALTIHQDAIASMAMIEPGQILAYPLKLGRYAWLQVARGGVALRSAAVPQGLDLDAGDGAAITDETDLVVVGQKPDGGLAEVVMFDMG